MKRYEGKSAIVTGAGMGIGKEIARRLASEGADLLVTDVLQPKLAETAAWIAGETGRRVETLVGSVDDPAAVAATAETATAAFGRIDVLVNNVSYTIKATLDECPPEDWDREVNATLRGAYRMCREIVPRMAAAGGGAVVNIGSVNGILYFGNPAYSAAKAGLYSLTQSLACEYGPKGVRTNMVSPGSIRTDNPTWTARAEKDPGIFDRLARWYPVGRIGRPEDIAAAVAFLAADEADFVNGANLVVDGGLTAGMPVMVDELTLERGT